MTKTIVLEAVQNLPEEFTLEELIERFIILEKIEIGLRQVKEGKTVTHEEAKKHFAKWLR